MRRLHFGLALSALGEAAFGQDFTAFGGYLRLERDFRFDRS